MAKDVLDERVHRPETPPVILRVWRFGEHWCVVADNGIGFYLGYVSLPEGHPWREPEVDELPAEVHGGVNWSHHRDWTEFEGDGAPPGYYIGFDCGHYCDTPIPGSYMSYHWPGFGPNIHPPWDEQDVANEVERLALQCQVALVVAHA